MIPRIIVGLFVKLKLMQKIKKSSGGAKHSYFLRPLWRIWRIIRNTMTGRYKEIANDNSLKEKYSK